VRFYLMYMSSSGRQEVLLLLVMHKVYINDCR